MHHLGGALVSRRSHAGSRRRRALKSVVLDLVDRIFALLELGHVDFGLATILPAEPDFARADGSDHGPREEEGKGQANRLERGKGATNWHVLARFSSCPLDSAVAPPAPITYCQKRNKKISSSWNRAEGERAMAASH